MFAIAFTWYLLVYVFVWPSRIEKAKTRPHRTNRTTIWTVLAGLSPYKRPERDHLRSTERLVRLRDPWFVLERSRNEGQNRETQRNIPFQPLVFAKHNVWVQKTWRFNVKSHKNFPCFLSVVFWAQDRIFYLKYETWQNSFEDRTGPFMARAAPWGLVRNRDHLVWTVPGSWPGPFNRTISMSFYGSPIAIALYPSSDTRCKFHRLSITSPHSYIDMPRNLLMNLHEFLLWLIPS